MGVQTINVRGHAGVLPQRTATEAQVKEKVIAFLQNNHTSEAGCKLALDPASLSLRYEYNGSWSIFCDAKVNAPDGSNLGTRNFEGRYTPESGGMSLKETTQQVFSANYYKDTSG